MVNLQRAEELGIDPERVRSLIRDIILQGDMREDMKDLYNIKKVKRHT